MRRKFSGRGRAGRIDSPREAGSGPSAPPGSGGGRGMSKGDPSGEARLSRASVGRLSLYLRRLKGLLQDGTTTVSSGQLGEALGIRDAQVRKDLASLGSLGLPGVGYPTQELITAIR